MQDADLNEQPAEIASDAAGLSRGPASGEPAVLFRTVEGRITFWSVDMEQRYGFTGEQAMERPSRTLLRTTAPQRWQEAEAILLDRNWWKGNLIHHHADGRALLTAHQWFLYRAGDGRPVSVMEVHSDIVLSGKAGYPQIAETLTTIAHQCSEPLTAIGSYVGAMQRMLQPVWPEPTCSQRESLRAAMSQVEIQLARSADSLRLLREFARALAGTGEPPGP